MAIEKKHIDLSTLTHDYSYEVVYPFGDLEELEPIHNLVPLKIAVELGLAKVIQPDGVNNFVVAPSVLTTNLEREADVYIVSTEWNVHPREREITTYTYDKCTNCGAPAFPETEYPEAHLGCGYCGAANHGTSPKPQNVSYQEFAVEDFADKSRWIGTVDELANQVKEYNANLTAGWWARIKYSFNSKDDPAPLEVIQAGNDLADPQQKIVIAGPFTDSEKDSLFIQIGELEEVDHEQKSRSQVEVYRGEDMPQAPGAYILEKASSITHRGDYLIIIEADSGERLPMIIMKDGNRNPSRFAIPLDALQDEGWRLTMNGLDTTLNSLIVKHGLDVRDGPRTVTTETFGTVKVFEWNPDSDRHEAITDYLDVYDFDSDITFISGDIPNGKVTQLFVEQTG